MKSSARSHISANESSKKGSTSKNCSAPVGVRTRCRPAATRRNFILLSIVIPAHNESARLPDTLHTVMGYLARRGREAELIVSDDGSSDGTAGIADEILARQSRFPWRVLVGARNRGKGFATRTGVLSARGDPILFTDADLSTPIEEVERLERALGDGWDVAIASRGLPRSKILVRQPRHREGMGRIFNLVMRVLVLPGICDSQCGFKLFTRKAVERIFPSSRVDGWAFDVELLRLARKAELGIAEVPVRWRHAAASKISILRGPPTMLIELVRIRLFLGGPS